MMRRSDMSVWTLEERHALLAVATGDSFERIDPATAGVVVSRFPTSTDAEVDGAVEAVALAAARRSWKDDPAARSAALLRWAELIESHADELATLLTREVGKNLFESQIEVGAATRMARHFAAQAVAVTGKAAVVAPDCHSVVLREPLGVVAIIVPWNWPLMLTMRAVCAALAGGNGVVVKPAELSTGCTVELLTLGVDAGLPEDILRAVLGSGHKVGQRMLQHEAIDAVSFTGSTEVGRRIATQAAERIMHVSLELGGKSPNVVFADADLVKAAAGILEALGTSGQACTAGARVLVEESVADDLERLLAEGLSERRPGDPLENTGIGPLITPQERDRVLEVIEQGKREGRLVADSGPVPESGNYVAAHLFADLPPESSLHLEETFGPVITIQRFSDETEAVALANATKYGLAAAVWTKDVHRAWRMGRAIDAGTCWVNTYHHFYDAIEETGWKVSGLGSVRGSGGVEAFTQRKHLNFDSMSGLW